MRAGLRKQKRYRKIVKEKLKGKQPTPENQRFFERFQKRHDALPGINLSKNPKGAL